jgi:hypothetical protein
LGYVDRNADHCENRIQFFSQWYAVFFMMVCAGVLSIYLCKSRGKRPGCEHILANAAANLGENVPISDNPPNGEWFYAPFTTHQLIIAGA